MKIERRQNLLAKMAALPAAVRKEFHDALDKSADEIADTAKRFAPAKSGALKNSISYTFGTYAPENANVRGVRATGGVGDQELTVTVHAGDARAYYAAWVEFGTAPHIAGGLYAGAQHPGARANPYFFPAYRLTKKRIKGRLSRATRKAVKSAVGVA